MRRTAVALACCIGLVPPASALDPDTPIQKYAVDSWQDGAGLPQNNVKVILQTRDGYIWVGTKGGLARFDGVRFTAMDDRRPGQLREGEVWALLEDDDASLWVGTFGGGLSRLENGQFTTYTSLDGLVSDFVTVLCKGKDGSLWIGTDQGLSQFKDGRFTSYTTKDGLIHNRVRGLFCDDQGALWIGAAEGLSSYRDGRFTNYPLGFKGDGRITSIVQGPDGALWMATFKDGLARFKDGKVTRFTVSDGLVSDSLNALCLDSVGTLWIAATDGLCRYRSGKMSCSHSRMESAARQRVAPPMFSLDHIQAVHEDREGNLWVGTANGGLARLKNTQFVNYGAEDGLADDEAHTVLEARDGTIWIGTVNGLTRFKGGAFTVFGIGDGLSDASVRSLFEDPDGTLWIGTTVGLNVLKEGRLRRVSHPLLDNKYFYAIMRDSRGDLWLGTNGDGLIRGHEGQYTHYTPADGLAGMEIRGLREDQSGTIWIGTKDGGLSRYKDGRFTTLTTDDGLAGNAVQAVYLDREGAIWASTRQGLSRINKGKVTNYTVSNGMPTNFIYQTSEDDRGDMWLTGSRGIFRIPWSELVRIEGGGTEPLNSIAYGPETGLRSAAQAVSSQPSICKGRDGRLWFASLKGVSVVDPARKPAEAVTLPVWVEEVRVDEQITEHHDVVDFPPGNGNVEIHYTALNFYAPEKVVFKYLLEGFDQDWVDAGTRRVAYYTRVPPGRYRFKVIAQDISGNWNEDGAGFAFSIAPHFYQTTWFALVCVAALGLVAWGGYRLRLGEVRKRFDAVLAERNRIARELHDGLDQVFTALSLQFEMTSKMASDAAGQNPDLNRRLELTQSLLDYARAETRRSITDLRSQDMDSGDVETAVSTMADQFRHAYEAKIDVRIEGRAQQLPASLGTNVIRICQEAISNAVRHGRAKQISIDLGFTGNALELRVKDSGSGFDVSKALSARDGHFGLAGMRERVRWLRGEMRVTSSPGEGTRLEVVIPYTVRTLPDTPRTRAVERARRALRRLRTLLSRRGRFDSEAADEGGSPTP